MPQPETVDAREGDGTSDGPSAENNNKNKVNDGAGTTTGNVPYHYL